VSAHSQQGEWRGLDMRYLLSFVAVLAALVFMAASAAMNWVFLASLGKSPLEAQIFGAVSVAVDVLKSLLPIFIGWSLASNRRSFAAIASVVFVLFFSFSLMSAIGFAAGNRGAVTGGKEVIALRYQAAVRDVAEVDNKLKALPPSRPQGVVVEALRGLEQDKRWSSSKNCTEATAGESRAYCEGYFKTKAELATALEAARLEERLTAHRGEVKRLQDVGAAEEADVQAGLLSRVVGVNVSTAQMALVMFVAVLVELGAAFGLYLATGFGMKPKAARVKVDAEILDEVPARASRRKKSQATGQAVTVLPSRNAFPLKPQRLGIAADGSLLIDQ